MDEDDDEDDGESDLVLTYNVFATGETIGRANVTAALRQGYRVLDVLTAAAGDSHGDPAGEMGRPVCFVTVVLTRDPDGSLYKMRPKA